MPPPGLAELLFAKYALRIEVADPTALRAGRRVNYRVDQGWFSGVHRLVDGALQLVGGRRIDANAAESFHHLVVARVLDEDRWRDIRSAGRIDVRATINAVVVEDHHTDRQVVAADRLDLHSGEAEGAVAFDREHGLAGFDRCRD